MQISINIIEEDLSVVAMMTDLFERHRFRYRTYRSAEDFLPALDDPNPSISFLSFGLPQQGVRRVLDRLRNGSVASSVILTCDDLATSQIVEAIKAGVEDILEKPFTSEQLIAAIERVHSSHAHCIPTRPMRSTEMDGTLTIEEQQILSLMEQGSTIKEIASKLDISVRTVHYRKASMLEKTNCKTCTEVVSKIAAMRSAGVIPAKIPMPDLMPPLGEVRSGEFPGGTVSENNRAY